MTGITLSWAGLLAVSCIYFAQADSVEDNRSSVDLVELQNLENKTLNRLLEKSDGPFEKHIKKLFAQYLVATALESVKSESLATNDRVSRAFQQQQQSQIVYVYVTPPPQNSNERTERTRRTRPPRTPRTPRTRRPSNNHHHHSQESSEERPAPPPTQPVVQPVYIRQPVYQQPQQEQPQSQISGVLQQPIQTAPASSGQTQQQPQPVQVIYVQASTPPAPTGPTTTRRPRPSQEHVYNQVNGILDNVGRGNITGIVDQALGIHTPMPTRNFVNGILNTVFCNPINRLLGRCRGQ